MPRLRLTGAPVQVGCTHLATGGTMGPRLSVRETPSACPALAPGPVYAGPYKDNTVGSFTAVASWTKGDAGEGRAEGTSGKCIALMVPMWLWAQANNLRPWALLNAQECTGRVVGVGRGNLSTSKLECRHRLPANLLAGHMREGGIQQSNIRTRSLPAHSYSTVSSRVQTVESRQWGISGCRLHLQAVTRTPCSTGNGHGVGRERTRTHAYRAQSVCVPVRHARVAYLAMDHQPGPPGGSPSWLALETPGQ